MEAAEAQRTAGMRYIVGADTYVPVKSSGAPVTDPLRAYGILPPGYVGDGTTGTRSNTTSSPVATTGATTTATTTGTTSTGSGTPGKRKVMVTPPQGKNVYGFRFDQDPNQTPIPMIPGAGSFINKDQILPLDIITSGKQSSPYQPQEVDMTGLGAYDPVIPKGSTRLNKFLVGARDTAKDVSKALSNPDTLGDIALGLKSLGIKKYKPSEPPVVSVSPRAGYLSPDRELAYNSEMAAMAGLIGNQMGNTRNAAAIGRGAQGQALTNAANILGKTYNANVGIKNQFETLATNLTNETLEKQRERAGRLNYDTFMANQMYRNQINDAMDATVKRAYQKENEARNIATANLDNKYWHYDKRGFPVWNFEGAREKHLKELEDVQKGTGLSSGTSVSSVADKLMAMGFTDRDEAIAEAKNYIKHHMGIPATETKTTTDESGKTKSTKTIKRKQGGFSPKSISKFLAHSLG
jgi:hypothetical protein